MLRKQTQGAKTGFYPPRGCPTVLNSAVVLPSRCCKVGYLGVFFLGCQTYFLSEVSEARYHGALSPEGEPGSWCLCFKYEMELREALLSKRICIGLEDFSF